MNPHPLYPQRRHFVTALAASAAGTLVSASLSRAFAQDVYPSRPITMIVPQAPGGANDAIARIITHNLSELMGRQFVVDNRAGAGGNIGTAIAAKAKPDGYMPKLRMCASSSSRSNLGM